MREPLTLEHAQAGVQPTPLTRAEWDAMHKASAAESEARIRRVALRAVQDWHDHRMFVPRGYV